MRVVWGATPVSPVHPVGTFAILELLGEHLDADEILVIVQGSMVTLAGFVATAIERQIAEDLVWHSGASGCENRLRCRAAPEQADLQS